MGTLTSGEPSRTNREVLSNKIYLASVAVDIAAGVFDAEMSHAGEAHQDHKAARYCVEGGRGLPQFPTRGELYRAFLPEQALIIGAGYFATKARFPRWFMPGVVAYPVYYHVRGGLGWYTGCW